MAITNSLGISYRSTYATTIKLSSITEAIVQNINSTFSSSDLYYAKQYVLSGDTYQDIDLRNFLDILNTSSAFDSLDVLIIENTGENSLIVGNADTTPFYALFGSGTDTMTIPAGGKMAFLLPDGISVDASTRHLRVAGVNTSFNLFILGVAGTPDPVVTRTPWNDNPNCLYLSSDAYAYVGSYNSFPAGIADFPSGNNARTLMLWLKDEDVSSSTLKAIMSYGTNVYQNEFVLGFYGNNIALDLGYNMYRSGLKRPCSRANSWKHLAITLGSGGNLGSVKIYIDGELLSSASDAYYGSASSGTAINTGLRDGFRIASPTSTMMGGGDRAAMKVAEVSVWNIELTQEQIQYYMPYCLEGDESGLLRVYHCDEGTGTSLADGCGGIYSATMSGGSWSTK